MSNPRPPVVHQRTSSKSGSISSISTTLRKSASLSTRSNPQPGFSRNRPVSPVEAFPADQDRRSSEVIVATTKNGGLTTPNLNINRWSHSTSSSVTTIEIDSKQVPGRRSSVRQPIVAASTVTATDTDRSSRKAQTSHPAIQTTSPSRSPARSLQSAARVPQASSTYFRNEPRMHATAMADVSPSKTTQPPPSSTYNSITSNLEAWQQKRNTNKLGDAVTAISMHYTAPVNPSNRPPNLTTGRRNNAPSEQARAIHTRQRERSSNNIHDAQNSRSSSRADSQSRSHRGPAEKTMLSKALSKANVAVLLDNKQDYTGAIEAYAQACDLLQQVLERSSDSDDRKKLSNIRETYSNRIAELHDLDDSFADLMNKDLPDDPEYDTIESPFSAASLSNGFDARNFKPTTATEVLESVQIPQRQESLLPQIFGGGPFVEETNMSLGRQVPPLRPQNLSVPMDSQLTPRPLSPRKEVPLKLAAEPVSSAPEVLPPEPKASAHHLRADSTESTSWLDGLGDSEHSDTSSLVSSIDYRLDRGTEFAVGSVEAEFSAALDAAVDTAYDDDEPEHETTPRQAGKRSMSALNDSNRSPSDQALGDIVDSSITFGSFRDSPELDADEMTAEEEEQLLDSVTDGHMFGDFDLDTEPGPTLPRQSDSSGFSGRTMGSSVPSTALTSGTVLTTLAEAIEGTSKMTAANLSPVKEFVTSTAPPPEVKKAEGNPNRSTSTLTIPHDRQNSLDKHVNLRDRRLSGQSASRQLKIETFAKKPLPQLQPQALPAPKVAASSSDSNARLDIPRIVYLPSQNEPESDTSLTVPSAMPLTSLTSTASHAGDSPATPGLLSDGLSAGMNDLGFMLHSPSALVAMLPSAHYVQRKPHPSSNLRLRTLSSGITEIETSPMTPGSAVFPPDIKGYLPPMTAGAHGVQNLSGVGMFLFDGHIGSPLATPSKMSEPRSSERGEFAPVPLEPCPESFLQRPFWLMRCLYQVVAHPLGGYITTKLFVPREIWRVKNVKIKMLDDKISQCDMLTAALQKLARVDNYDADAVLEELQLFETVIEQVRSVLQKKLGSDVGLSSSTNIFKSPTEESGDPIASKSSNSSSLAAKSFASSWRKLRSKSSNAPFSLPTGGSAATNTRSGGHATGSPFSSLSADLTMPTLPMISSSAITASSRGQSYQNRLRRAQPQSPSGMTNIPSPHASYMSSLTRLFDAVQILDSFARQVEDPGLKCSSKTQVGLELSVRNAAEFFAFFIVRFVMADVMLLVDKFLKRGSEWVLT